MTKTKELVLEDNQLLCLLSGEAKKDKSQERNLQALILMLNEEYGFELDDMERDFTIVVEYDDGKKSKKKAELVIFEKGQAHEQDNIIRMCVVQDEKVKENDPKKGVEITLETIMDAVEGCEFGVWTNGFTFHFLQQEEDKYGNFVFTDLSDFPGEGESIEDLERADRAEARIPAGDSLVRTFKYCHDYIYGNEGMKKTAFWELLNLIFCKIYDERRKTMPSPDGSSYRRRFWVGVKERNTPEGLKAIADRIKGIFDELKNAPIFKEVFDGSESIKLTDKGLAFIAAELSKYNFLNASVDVKGTAYETIVGNTFKKEDGQFFTPKNIIKCMVDILDPQPNQRILDPACGSGGFLVVALDHVRRKLAKQLYPELDGLWLEAKFNSPDVNEAVKEYAGTYLFGFDFDPDLKKAARMNMVMSGDGHGNIFHLNSLAYPKWDNQDELDKVKKAIKNSIAKSDDKDASFKYEDARGKFDVIFTNPPFGAKIPINDKEILKQYDLGYKWSKDEQGNWRKKSLSKSEPPEILFVDACYQFLKPGGKMGIVLPDGILSNPNTEYMRSWILDRFKVIASIDLAVEAFLPQVGVQASLLFMQKKTDKERQIAQEHREVYNVFMAIAEKLGKDRRGNPIYLRDDDGAEILFSETREYLHTDKKGETKIRTRKEKIKHLDDDLPKISLEFTKFKTAKK